jgi:hypothetical protein
MYKLSNPVIPNGQSLFVGRLSDNTWISLSPEHHDNTDYQAYLAWVEQGNTPLPADEGVA